VGTTEGETLLAPVKEAKEGTSGGANKRNAGSTPPRGGKKKQKKKAKRNGGPEAIDPFRRAQADNLLAVIYFRDHPYRVLTHSDHEQVKTELMSRLCDAARSLPLRALAVGMVDWMLPVLPLRRMSGCTMLSTRLRFLGTPGGNSTSVRSLWKRTKAC